MNYNEIFNVAADTGFTHVVSLNIGTIKLKPEVRQMCETNTCGEYGRRWSCPPGCGSLGSCREKIASYKQGILVQTVGLLEDELDGEGMMETERIHKEHFLSLYELLRRQFQRVLALGTGCCTWCESCTYPSAPCRFPEKQISSMEAYGILVLEACRANGLPYYYGRCTIAYTGCFLLD